MKFLQARMTKSLDDAGNELNTTVFTSVAFSIPYETGSMVVQVDLDNSENNDFKNMSVSIDGARFDSMQAANLNAGCKL